MKVLYVASEIAPYAATGGLAEIGSGLPRALINQGVEVIRVMPFYRQVAESDFAVEDTGVRLEIPLGFRMQRADLWKAADDNVTTYFIRKDEFFDRSQLYSLPDRDYDDNFERFVFFQKAVVAMVDALGLRPDIVQTIDWQTGLLPLWLQHGINGMGRNRTEKSVFTIHNLAYQGRFPGSQYSITNLPFFCFSVDTLEYYGDVNSLKAGITTSNAAVAVSRNYAREIRDEKFGLGLHGVLNSVGNRLSGINIGVDYGLWDPRNDPYLTQSYSADDLAGKAVCKEELMVLVDLQVPRPRPLFGMLCRLVDQKGLDLLAGAIADLMKLDVGLVLLGVGQARYHQMCQEWMKQWPGRFHAMFEFNARMGHRILAGCDACLVPSKFEPCGLTPLSGLRYGTIPVAHATGGIVDIITDVNEDRDHGTGFLFKDYNEDGLLSACRRALELYARPAEWTALTQRAMRCCFSWDQTAQEYHRLYQTLLG